MRRRLRSSSPLVVLGLGIAAITAYVLTVALDATGYFNDEYGMVTAGRAMARHPAEIFAASPAGLGRGPERLTSVVLALPDAIFSSTAAQMRAGRALLALAYALVALPAYALMRGLDVPRWGAVALALAAAASPWMVFGTTMLNVTLAAPLTIAFAWAAWRAVVEPSLARETLALALAVLMTLARTSHGAFFLAAVLAAVAAAWWTRPTGEGVMRLPRRVLRRTPLIAATAVVGLVLVVLFGPDRFVGRAYAGAAKFSVPLDQLGLSLSFTTRTLAIATGFIAVPIGGAWALRQLIRPAGVRTGAFAVIAVAMFALFAYVSAAAGAEQQERYPAVLAALPLIALGAALFRRREAWALGTAVIGLLAARAIAGGHDGGPAEPLTYFFLPSQLFFANVVVGRLTLALPGDPYMVTIATVGAAVLAVAVAALTTRRWIAWAAVAGVTVLGVVAGVQTVRKFEPATRPGDPEALAWLDRATGGRDAVLWNYTWPANAADRNVRTRITLFHNASACCAEWPPDYAQYVGDDGILPAGPVPEYVASPAGFRPLAFAAVEVSRPVALGWPMRVERFTDAPPRAAAIVEGAGDDGAVGRSPARIKALPASRGRCLDLELIGPPGGSRSARFSIDDHRGRVKPRARRWVRIRGSAAVRRTGRRGAPLVLGELRLVDCDAAPTRR